MHKKLLGILFRTYRSRKCQRFFRIRNSNKHITRIRGNTIATSNPALNPIPIVFCTDISNLVRNEVSPFCTFPETSPTNTGPKEHPTSPAKAKSANIAVPPAGKYAEVILKTPGHISPTDKPHSAHPKRESHGIGANTQSK